MAGNDGVEFGVETLAEGDGVNFPKKGDKVTVHYTGKVDLLLID